VSATAPAVLRWSREIVAAAARHDIPPEIIAAMVHQESAGDHKAYRYEPGWRYWYLTGGVLRAPAGISLPTERMQQATSWGLMQVMGAVAREMGCELKWLADIRDDPALALDLGCSYLARLRKRFGGGVERWLGAYNSGSPKEPGSDTWVKYVAPIMERVAAYRSALITGEP